MNVDAIAHAPDADGRPADCAFTVAESRPAARAGDQRAAAAVAGRARSVTERCRGQGVGGRRWAWRIRRGWPRAPSPRWGRLGIPIDMVTTSQVRITCLVPQSRMEEAVQLLHQRLRPGRAAPAAGARCPRANGADSCLTVRPEVTLWNAVKVGVLGASGAVGQRYCVLLIDHPWFEMGALAARSGAAGRR